MFDLVPGARLLAAAAAVAILSAGCSSAEPPPAPLPVAAPTPVAPPVAVVPPGETSPGALTLAEAIASPTRGFVLATGAPARCLESRNSTRAVLGDCRPVAGQVWSLTPTPGEPASSPTAPGPADTTYRLLNRTRGAAPLCFEGAPRVARDGAANTPCGDTAGQSWRAVPTTAGFYRLRTDADACLGATPAGTAAPGVAMVPCEPLERPPGAPRSTQDWELLPAPALPAPPRPRPAPRTTAPTPKPKPAPTTAVGELLASVNAERAQAGCGPVRRDARLDRAATAHGRWMASGGEFSHTGQGGSSPAERVEAEGWNGGHGENIAEGQTSVDEVMTDWMNSPGHRRNILDCEFTSVGLARVGSGSDQKWVQDFGSD